MKDLRDLAYEDMVELAAALGERPYRAAQLYGWVYKKGAPSVDAMTDLPLALRERLKEGYRISPAEVVETRESGDGTRKFVSMLSGAVAIETVIIPEGGRLTLCVSSQAGCALGCRFCATGRMGLVRNLALSELVGQVQSTERLLKEGERVTNIVLMGMGEPLANIENVLKFIRILTDPAGYGVSHNRVTVSTAGLAPGIKRLASETDVNIAISLNATTDEARERLMPVNRKYPLADLLAALRGLRARGRRKITVEYVLIKNVNDGAEDAKRLMKLLKGIPCRINLIPFNPFPGARFERPEERSVSAFWKILRDSGLIVMVRQSRGGDVGAACGQLSGAFREPEPGNDRVTDGKTITGHDMPANAPKRC